MINFIYSFLNIFQGCEGEIESLIQESSSNIIDNVMSVCRITGELALATDTRMVSLEVFQMDDSSTIDKVPYSSNILAFKTIYYFESRITLVY